MENQALATIKRFRSTGFKVWIYINTLLSVLGLFGMIFGTHEVPWYDDLIIYLAWFINVLSIERRYTAFHNPSKIYKEVNK